MGNCHFKPDLDSENFTGKVSLPAFLSGDQLALIFCWHFVLQRFPRTTSTTSIVLAKVASEKSGESSEKKWSSTSQWRKCLRQESSPSAVSSQSWMNDKSWPVCTTPSSSTCTTPSRTGKTCTSSWTSSQAATSGTTCVATEGLTKKPLVSTH